VNIANSSTKPLSELYLQLSKKESEKERRWHWVRSVEEDREIMAAIDAEQSSTEEKLAFLMWLALQEEKGYHIDCSKWGVAGGSGWNGSYEFQNWYIPILEEMEISSDGDKWAEEVEQLRLTLERPFGRSVTANGREYRNMTTPMSCTLVKKGPNYWTAQADNDLGKIYIPINIIPRWLQEEARTNNHLSLFAEVAFKGFTACRGRDLPWRAEFVGIQY
jgi:hypothetical protein